MGHGKETPRQKMIGLMYLFLTALMALNVSKDVLNSFVLVSESLEQTVTNYKTKNEKIYNEFDLQYMQNKAKVEKWKSLADQVRAKAQGLYDQLESHKLGLVTLAEGPESAAIVEGKVDANLLESKDNIDYGGQYFIVDKHGEELRKQIDEYRELLLTMIPEEEENLRSNIESTLDTHPHKAKKDEAPHPWESAVFEHIPLVADLVMLAKLQTDIKNVETDVITYLFKKISASDFKVNKMSATVIPNSSYIMKGNEYRAEVFLAAYDSTQNPEILVGNYKATGSNSYEMIGSYKTLDIENGKGIYKLSPGSLGNQKWRGIIRVKSPDGGVSDYPFEQEFEVSEPSLVISPTKMNVFYYGIENPVAISVPGISESNIEATIPGGGASIRKVKDGYEVKPTKSGGTVAVSVSAKIDGKLKPVGKMEFRIKTIPEPKAKVMGQASGAISKAIISNAPGVVAELEDFVFDLKFRVTRFTLSANVGGYTREMVSTGNSFTSEQKEFLKTIKVNSKINIEDIQAVGPDGRTISLSPLIFKVN